MEAQPSLPPVGFKLVSQGLHSLLNALVESSGTLIGACDQRLSEDHSARGLTRPLFAALQQRTSARYVDRHHRHIAFLRQMRCARSEGHAPAVFAAAAFGIEQQAPAFAYQLGCVIGGAAVGAVAFYGDGADADGRKHACGSVAEEIVGGCAHHQLVPPRFGDGSEEQGGVGVAAVVGDEDEGRVGELGKAVCAEAFRLGVVSHNRPPACFHYESTAETGRIAARPFCVEVGTGSRQMIGDFRISRGVGFSPGEFVGQDVGRAGEASCLSLQVSDSGDCGGSGFH